MSARVRFEPSGVELGVMAGERVLDAADEHPEVGLPLACRAGNCGACLVTVRTAAARFAPASGHELETLGALGAGADQRLACMLAVESLAADDGSPIVLAVVAPRPRDDRKS